MHNLRHFYYQNKEKIWKVILITVFVLGVIYFLNYLVGKEAKKGNTLSSNNNSTYYNEDRNTYVLGNTAISGQELTQKDVEKIDNIIGQFLEYCKNGRVEEAYNMLSEDCKTNRYNSLEKFDKQYVKTKFGAHKTFEVQKWEGNTYRITISEDALATGNINNSVKIEEYITIQEEDKENRLNINGYIGNQKINKQTEANNIKITALSKDVYMDYEIYKLKVENLSNKQIKMDTLEETDSIYIKDEAKNKYLAYMHELLEDELVIDEKQTSEIEIKFANTYKFSKRMTQLVFENMILDYNRYRNEKDDSKKSQNVYNFTINL